MPTFLSTLVVTVFVVIFLNAPKHHGAYKAPNTGPLGTLVYSLLMMLISLPTAILTYRLAAPSYLNEVLNLTNFVVPLLLLTDCPISSPWSRYASS